MISTWLDGLRPSAGLSPAQERVFETVKRNQQLASYSDVAAIAARAGVDKSTVVRCAQRLGFRGWPTLQHELRARYLLEISSEQTLEQHHRETDGVVHDAVRHDMENLRLALETVDRDDAERAVAALGEAEHLLVLGQGSFAGPATVFAHLAATMGYRAQLESRGGPHLATAVSALGPGDVVLLVNPWRPMRELLAAARAARAAGARVVSISDLERGPVAQVSDVPLVAPSEGVSFFQSVTAITAVVYGLLAGMQATRPEKTRAAIQGVQRAWRAMDTYDDGPRGGASGS